MGTANRRLATITAYFLIYVVWGSTYYFIGVALQGLPTFLLGALRFSAAGILLLAICRLRHEKIFSTRLIRRSAVSGIILLFIDMAVIMIAQRYVSSSLVAIVASSTAIWIMLLDVPMWKYNLRSISKVAGILMGFAGVALLYMEQLALETTAYTHSEYGILILAGGCISWAVGSLYAKYRSSATEYTNNFAGSAWQMLSAGTMFWACSILMDECRGINFADIPPASWMSLSYLIIFGSILAYSAYVWLLKVRPATEVATHAYVNPVVAVILGVGLGHEDVTLTQIAGLAVIIISVMLVNKKPYRRKPAQPTTGT